MEKQYRYTASVQVRPRGSIGAFYTTEFPVVLPEVRATAGQVFDRWHAMAGELFEPGAIVRINGEFTQGMGVDYGFSGEEVTHGL
jgi:hypothetical protein